jgi:hypothetical protein
MHGEMVVSIGDDDIVGFEGFGNALLENWSMVLPLINIVALNVSKTKQMREGHRNSCFPYVMLALTRR